MMTLEEFLKAPTAEEWQRELNEGWQGSDGSTSSTDTIFGVRIGITGRNHANHALPATLHDWHYRLGRRYRLPESYRKEADILYRDGCIACTDAELGPVLRRAARARAWTRYWTLRAFGRKAFTEDAHVC